MIGGDEAQPGAGHPRRRPWGWGLFVLVVLGLRISALGNEPPVAGADPGVEPAPEDGDLGATARLEWVVTVADPLAAADHARSCLAAGVGCTGDDLLAVDTTRARAWAFATSLASAVDPGSDGFVGTPSARAAELADDSRRAAEEVEAVLTEWSTLGCGGTVGGVVVEAPPPSCPDVGARALAALDRLHQALAGWAA